VSIGGGGFFLASQVHAANLDNIRFFLPTAPQIGQF